MRYWGLALDVDAGCVIDGDVPICWGDFLEGFGGPEPRRLTELGGARKVAIAEGTSACVLMESGALRCFGAINEDERARDTEAELELLASQLDRALTDQAAEAIEREMEEVGARLSPMTLATDVRDVFVHDEGGCYLTDAVHCWVEGREESFPEFTIASDDEIVQLGAASTHRCLLQANGRVRCWGGNVGLGWVREDEDERHPGLTPAHDAVEIALGEDFTCYRRADGTVACWGAIAEFLAVGSGPDGDHIPFDVPGVEGATHIAAGHQHACAIVAEGRVVCWGDNRDGALGVGTIEPVDVPVEVAALSPAREIALGYGTTCALVGDEVRCVGSNRHSVFGTTAREEPVLFPARGTRVVTAGYRTCVETHGELICTAGVHGWPITRNIQLSPLADDERAVKAVDGFLAYECVLRDGEAECGARGQPGHVLSNVSAVSVGTTASCALERSGRLLCWRNRANPRSHADLLNRHSNPTRIPGVEHAQSLDVAQAHACAVQTNGRVMCWGDNRRGLVRRPSGELNAPVELDGIRDAVQVSLNRRSTCVRKRDQRVQCRTTSDWQDIELAGVIDIVARGYERYLLTTDHRVYRLPPNLEPEPFELPAEIVEISAGTFHTCARARDGRVWCWGVGEHGELGVLPRWIHLEPIVVAVARR